MADPGGEVRGIQREKVTAWLAEHVPGVRPPFEFELIVGGHSNLTYRVTDARGERLVLRRPPLGAVLATAHDMSREHRIISGVGRTSVPVPLALGLCEDASINGAPFYVMGFVDGHVLQTADDARRVLPDEALRAQLAEAVVDGLAELHTTEPDAIGLGDLGRREAYLDRQLRRWHGQWEKSKTRELPVFDEVHALLLAARPDQLYTGIVHGDYRLGNMALAPDDPGRVVAIFDWEMATLGDPLADLGYTLIYWVEEGDPRPAGSIDAVGAVTANPGFLTRAQVAEAYAARSGRDLAHLDFYQVLALTKLAVIAEGITKRFQLGKTAGAGFEKMGRAAEPLAERALAIAGASQSAALRGG